MGVHWETSSPQLRLFYFLKSQVDMNFWIFLDIHCIELVGSEGHEKGMTLIDTREMLHCTMLSRPYQTIRLLQCYLNVIRLIINNGIAHTPPVPSPARHHLQHEQELELET